MARKNKYYVVTMYRLGERGKHSYCLGVFTKKETAIKVGDNHRAWRGRQYDPEILEIDINQIYYGETGVTPKEIRAI